MASFTDQIMQFNPYVPQLPVEAMVKVGTYKQQKYDEGIQKIQDQIDTIAGLDIIQPIHRKYLQSKLDELGNNLKTVAAGDFSNFQLVNSVSGMTKQIVRDPYVQTGVKNTAWYRKQAAQMEDDIKNGKSSQSNIYDFQKKGQKLMSSTDLGYSFDERYTPYRDIRKKAMEAIKALNPNLLKYDIPFEIMPDGTVNKEKIADAIKRYNIKGVSENQIAQAITATFDTDDYNQLRLDANYQLKDYGTNDLLARAKTNFESSISEAQRMLTRLETKKATETDPGELLDIGEKIEFYKSLLGDGTKPGELQRRYEQNIKEANENPEAAIYSIYKDGFIKEFANAFSWENSEVEYVTSPLRQQKNWVLDYNQKVQQHADTIGLRRQEIALKIEENRLKAEENALKRLDTYGFQQQWTPLLNPTDAKNMGRELFSGYVTDVKNSAESAEATLRGRGYTQNQVNEMFDDWLKNGVKGTKVPAAAVDLLAQMAKDRAHLKELETFETNLRNEAKKESGLTGVLQKVAKGKTGIDVTINGKRFQLTPEELLEIKAATTLKGQTIGGVGTMGVSEVYQTVDRGSLSSKQLAYLDEYAKVKGRPGFGTVEEQHEKAFDQFSKKDVMDAYVNFNKVYNEKLGEFATEFVPQIKGAPIGKDRKIAPQMVNNLTAFISRADIGKYKYDENFNAATAANMLSNERLADSQVFVEQKGRNYVIHIKNIGDDFKNTPVQKLSLTQSEVVKYFGPEYVNPRVQESMRLVLGRGSTNINKDAQSAAMQQTFLDFPGIKSMQVNADLSSDMSNPDLYIPTIYIKTKSGVWAPFEFSGYNKEKRQGYETLKRNLNNLTDETLLKELKQYYPNFDTSTLDIK